MGIIRVETILEDDKHRKMSQPSMSQSVGNCASCTGSVGSSASVASGGSGKTRRVMKSNEGGLFGTGKIDEESQSLLVRFQEAMSL